MDSPLDTQARAGVTSGALCTARGGSLSLIGRSHGHVSLTGDSESGQVYYSAKGNAGPPSGARLLLLTLASLKLGFLCQCRGKNGSRPAKVAVFVSTYVTPITPCVIRVCRRPDPYDPFTDGAARRRPLHVGHVLFEVSGRGGSRGGAEVASTALWGHCRSSEWWPGWPPLVLTERGSITLT
jgi:hypothetical protein